ncbi:MAG: hypothetical protein Q8M08_08095 [Bacteroidales bacterium]|nr:hypothetical protein [Bacteroidales bacterium]
MKKSNFYSLIATLALIIAIFISGCKKKADDPVPSFTFSADTVMLVGGVPGVQFYAKCTNNGVSMGNVTLTTPQDSLYIYNHNGASFAQNALIPLQGTNQAYPRRIGTWKINLTGNSTGGTAFAMDATIAVSK